MRLENNASVTRHMYLLTPLGGTVKNGKWKNHVFTSSSRAIIDDNLGVVVMTIHFT